MKVAIVGAGLSGMACALELKKNGIVPVIFEKRDKVGGRIEIPGAALRIFNRDYKDPLTYFKKKYDLDISALSHVRKVSMMFPSTDVEVKGNLGYLFKRGTQEDSLENQLASKAGLEIQFDSFIDINKIRKDFDYVVVSSGSTSVAQALGLLTVTFNAQSRTAYIAGDFERDRIDMWLNTEYSRNCYCFFCAHSRREGRLVLIADNITHKELDYYWNKFMEMERISYRIIETRDSEHIMGTVKEVCFENLYFTGDACGLVDNFLGFGLLNAVESGLLAARSIVGKADYAKRIEPFFNYLEMLHEYRKAMNTFTNKDLNRLGTLLGLPVIKQLIYRNPLFNVKYGYPLVKLFNYTRNNS